MYTNEHERGKRILVFREGFLIAAILNAPSCFKDLVLKMYMRIAYYSLD